MRIFMAEFNERDDLNSLAKPRIMVIQHQTTLEFPGLRFNRIAITTFHGNLYKQQTGSQVDGSVAVRTKP